MKAAIMSFLTLCALGTAVNAHAAVCHNVDIRVNNQGTIKILALSIEYMSVEDGNWHPEAFVNSEVPAGTLKTVAADQDLSFIEGHNMKHIKLHYKVWCGGQWSVEMTHTDSSFSSPTCTSHSNKSYTVDLPASAVHC